MSTRVEINSLGVGFVTSRVEQCSAMVLKRASTAAMRRGSLPEVAFGVI